MNINQSNFYEAIRYFLQFHYNKALVSHVNGCIIRLRAWTLNTSAKRCLCSNRRLKIWKARQEKQSWICKWWVHGYFKQVLLDFKIFTKQLPSPDLIYCYNQVRSKIMNTTNEMRKIADGLGSGVSPDQIRSSIDLGTTWLQEIKDIGRSTFIMFSGIKVFYQKYQICFLLPWHQNTDTLFHRFRGWSKKRWRITTVIPGFGNQRNRIFLRWNLIQGPGFRRGK